MCQHLGNLPPAEPAGNELFPQVRVADGDVALLSEFAWIEKQVGETCDTCSSAPRCRGSSPAALHDPEARSPVYQRTCSPLRNYVPLPMKAAFRVFWSPATERFLRVLLGVVAKVPRPS